MICSVCEKKESIDGVCDDCRRLEEQKRLNAEQVMFEFSRIGTMVDILFTFVSVLTAQSIEIHEVDAVLQGFRETIETSENVHKDAAKAALDHFQLAVTKYKEVV